MTEENVDQEVNVEQPDELTLLKQQADIMGIKYHPSTGIAKLKAKIEEAREGNAIADEYAEEEAETIAAFQEANTGAKVAPKAVPTPQQQKMARREKALRLVRVRVTDMNPLNSNKKGEIFSAGNAEIGFVKKFVPFNAEQGWHVPQIILTMMQNKKFMTHYETKIGGKVIKKNKLVPQYAIEILPSLTAKELEELKQRQMMAQGQ